MMPEFAQLKPTPNLSLDRRLRARRTESPVMLALRQGGLEAMAALVSLLVPTLAYHGLVLHTAALHDSGAYAALIALVGGMQGLAAAWDAGRFVAGDRSITATAGRAARTWTVAFALATAVLFLADMLPLLSRASMVLAFVSGLLVLVGVRTTLYSGLNARIAAGRLQHSRLVLAGRKADIERFVGSWQVWSGGFAIADRLHLDLDAPGSDEAAASALVEFTKLWVGRGVDTVVLVGDRDGLEALTQMSARLKRFAINVICAPVGMDDALPVLDLVPLGRATALQVLKKPMSNSAVALKRAFDLLGAGFGLVLLAPLLGFTALAIMLDSPGRVLFRQERRGFNGEVFFIYKFRSMRVTESGHAMRQAARDDDRITRVGRFIRATSIDELPQLLNVLKGDMSLVGPRPHAVKHDAELEAQLADYAHRQRLKPGITGWAQVNGFRGETRTHEQMAGRTRHDLHYIDNWSILLDCWIIVLTLFSRKVRQNAF